MAGNKIRGFKHKTGTSLFAMLLGLCATTPLAAQEAQFACTGLIQSETIPSVAGARGMFYRVDPDLKMAHEITKEIAQDLGQLSAALAAQGTTLIYVPMPTKALGQPQDLPWAAGDLGYDIDIAATVYDKDVRRLKETGIRTLNARQILATAAQKAPVYFGPDSRLNPNGVRSLATAVAAEITGAQFYNTLPKVPLKTGFGGKVDLISNMRFDLQEHCEKILPRLTINQVVMSQGSSPQDLFDDPNVDIAFISSAVSGTPELGFAQYLQELTGLRTGRYSLIEGETLAAMSAYMTSQNFQNRRPKFLVWSQPIWQDLGKFGDQPMRELLAAAGPACDIDLPLRFENATNVYRADLSGLDPRRSYTLFLDSDTGGIGARFNFTSASNDVRSQTIYRAPDQALTGRFYMPMSGLWPEGASHVDIQLGGSAGNSPRLRACQQEELN